MGRTRKDIAAGLRVWVEYYGIDNIKKFLADIATTVEKGRSVRRPQYRLFIEQDRLIVQATTQWQLNVLEVVCVRLKLNVARPFNDYYRFEIDLY